MVTAPLKILKADAMLFLKAETKLEPVAVATLTPTKLYNKLKKPM